MKRLVPTLSSSDQPAFDPVLNFPDDVARLVAVAKEAGYFVSPAEAGEIWRRSSESVCAGWLSRSTWREVDILEQMTRYGEAAEDPENLPAPPKGYASWLDYAVECIDTRSVELGHIKNDFPSRLF